MNLNALRFRQHARLATAPFIFNEDCVNGAASRIPDEAVDLIVTDPPFGISEASFHRFYNRPNDRLVIPGYVEAPKDYFGFTLAWLQQAKRVLKPEGSMYVVMGHQNLRHVLNAVEELQLTTINMIALHLTFGVYTTRKFVNSHYHVLYLKKSPTTPVTFNTYCRFGPEDRDERARSKNYLDRESVWKFNRSFARPGEWRNNNKLPDPFIRKIIEYSSNPGDIVADFFLGNFTTARVAMALGRIPLGFEMNPNSFNHHYPLLIGGRCAA